MIWQAGTPNTTKTWLGYLKDDGFEKRKHKGRIDEKKKRDGIKNYFLDAYRNNDEITLLSVKKVLTAQDEWLAEAYMETDYSQLKEEDFMKTIRKYIAFTVSH